MNHALRAFRKLDYQYLRSLHPILVLSLLILNFMHLLQHIRLLLPVSIHLPILRSFDEYVYQLHQLVLRTLQYTRLLDLLFLDNLFLV